MPSTTTPRHAGRTRPPAGHPRLRTRDRRYRWKRHAPVGTADTGSPFDEPGIDTPDFGVDLWAPARGLAAWAIWGEIGVNGARERTVHDNGCARRVADRGRNEAMLELLADANAPVDEALVVAADLVAGS